MLELFTQLADFITYNLLKIDPVEIATRGVVSTPAVIVDGKLVHKGGVPHEAAIEEWLK